MKKIALILVAVLTLASCTKKPIQSQAPAVVSPVSTPTLTANQRILDIAGEEMNSVIIYNHYSINNKTLSDSVGLTFKSIIVNLNDTIYWTTGAVTVLGGNLVTTYSPQNGSNYNISIVK